MVNLKTHPTRTSSTFLKKRGKILWASKQNDQVTYTEKNISLASEFSVPIAQDKTRVGQYFKGFKVEERRSKAERIKRKGIEDTSNRCYGHQAEEI